MIAQRIADETLSTSIDNNTPTTIDGHLIMLIDVKHQRGGISFYLVNYVRMIYVFTKLRVDIHWGQCNLSLGRGLLTVILFYEFYKMFSKSFYLVKKGIMNF